MPVSSNNKIVPSKRLVVAAITTAACLLAVVVGLFPQLLGDERDQILYSQLHSSHDELSSLDAASNSTSFSLSSSSLSLTSSQPTVAIHGSSNAPYNDEASKEGTLAYANAHPVNFNEKIDSYLQFPELPGACEVASLLCVLRSMEFEIDAVPFCDTYLLSLSGEPDMVHGFSGSPYDQGAAFPPIIARAGNAYLYEQESSWRFVECKGSSIGRLLSVVDTGRPVLVWNTMELGMPDFIGTSVEGYRWYTNQHCVVLYGQTEDGHVKVMDPLAGLVEYDYNQFEEVYNACGKMAITLTRVMSDDIDVDTLSHDETTEQEHEAENVESV